MRSKHTFTLVIAFVLSAVVMSAGIAVAADDGPGEDDADQALTLEAGTKASDAALATTGGGTVLASESDDGGAGYEVEIRNADGSETEVELDKNFNLVQRAEDEEVIEKTTVPDVTARDFDKRNFSDSTKVDNVWLPLKPGTQLVFTGNTIEDGEKTGHRVIFTVTDLVKTIDGVRSVVLWDRDYSDGELVESEIAFFAQDDDGNVWQTGEYPQEYEAGKIIASPIWIHGQKGARAGLTMRADPRLGTKDYSLGWGPAVGFNDRARVFRMGQRNCVPIACFTNVLVTEEFNPDEPGSQLKYYARSVGNTRVGWSGKDEKTKETLVLVEINALDAKAMAEARREARKLEASAYEREPAVYGETPPLTRG